jgi:hypothetical protein
MQFDSRSIGFGMCLAPGAPTLERRKIILSGSPRHKQLDPSRSFSRQSLELVIPNH